MLALVSITGRTAFPYPSNNGGNESPNGNESETIFNSAGSLTSRGVIPLTGGNVPATSLRNGGRGLFSKPPHSAPKAQKGPRDHG